MRRLQNYLWQISTYYALSTDYMSGEQMQEWLVMKHIHGELVMDERACDQILAIEILPTE